jgi:hypothetical protein
MGTFPRRAPSTLTQRKRSKGGPERRQYFHFCSSSLDTDDLDSELHGTTPLVGGNELKQPRFPTPSSCQACSHFAHRVEDGGNYETWPASRIFALKPPGLFHVILASGTLSKRTRGWSRVSWGSPESDKTGALIYPKPISHLWRGSGNHQPTGLAAPSRGERRASQKSKGRRR